LEKQTEWKRKRSDSVGRTSRLKKATLPSYPHTAIPRGLEVGGVIRKILYLAGWKLKKIDGKKFGKSPRQECRGENIIQLD
jgi:hypothetical protein